MSTSTRRQPPSCRRHRPAPPAACLPNVLRPQTAWLSEAPAIRPCLLAARPRRLDVGYPWSKANDVWGSGELRAYRREWHGALLSLLAARGGRYPVSGAYLWSLMSLDPQVGSGCVGWGVGWGDAGSALAPSMAQLQPADAPAYSLRLAAGPHRCLAEPVA